MSADTGHLSEHEPAAAHAPAQARANHLTAQPVDDYSWRPLQRSTRVAVALALAVTIYYVVFLLNPAYRGNPWLWGAVLFAEGLTVFQALGTWWTVLANQGHPDTTEVVLNRRRLTTGSWTPTVDVFITACGEPVEIVDGTIRAARDMAVPHKTWILDDGKSDELRDLCAELGVGYLRRGDNAHAKAGNVNAGLARTDGDFVVILDADHVPSPDFLVRALPHLFDDGVAFAQTPQAFPAAKGLVATGTAEAQRIFYELVCPGKNHFNAVFCVGTNVIFRRAALDQLGGMWTASNSEDIWTSIELHRRGWRSVFVPETLARGLAPDNLLAFFKQQFRWSYGGFEILLRGGIFRRKGLTLDQRFQYLLTGTNYLLSLGAMVLMLLPSAYLLLGLSPVTATMSVWLTHYVPFYTLVLAVTWLQTGGFKPSAVVTSIGAAPIHLRALVMAVLGRKAKWTVTNVKSGRLPGVQLVLPHVALLILNVTAIAVGIATMTDPLATGLSVVWASLHVLVLGRVVVEAVLAPGQERERREDRKAGARIIRALPWPARTDDERSAQALA
ncbi:glycosyltransferase family 2 protein [Kineosporia sp. R_H_3]|uniref:glycosyltransferase family 2 protein n=1 Tax=Kineosporia sp. R_H_3 TaxID=1961848 RepID=UPI000B4B57D2|nr:glycosyltransferase family 2 protein [Kineosporia sp. R_H_3]